MKNRSKHRVYSFSEGGRLDEYKAKARLDGLDALGRGPGDVSRRGRQRRGKCSTEERGQRSAAGRGEHILRQPLLGGDGGRLLGLVQLLVLRVLGNPELLHRR